MKILLYISTWLLALCSYAQTHSITLGKGENCQGYNICMIVPFDKAKPLQKNESAVYISTTKDNRVLFLFPKSSLNDALFLKYFATGFFVLDADYVLPKDIASQLKVAQLKTGRYKIVATADSYEIVF